MLLETLDLLKNDVIIYSENKFDLEKNFKIIYKKSEIKTPKRIDFFEVCNFINDSLPKNLIAYRLLTNVNSIDAFSTKFGFFINSDNGFELIYFDPIFALNDLSNLQLQIDPNLFRFKIQQVGFLSLPAKNDVANYGEVYAFDLKSEEAKNQNDKIFAKAIFALDESFIDDEKENSFDLPKTSNRMILEDLSNKKNKFTKQIIYAEKSINEINELNLRNLSMNYSETQKGNFASSERYEINKSNLIKKKSFGDLVKSKTVGDQYDISLLGNVAKEHQNRDEVVLKFNR